MTARIFVCILVMAGSLFPLMSCSSDSFGVSGEGTGHDNVTGGQPAETGSGGSGEGDMGNENELATGGGQGSGGNGEDGIRRGPELSDVDTTLGGTSSDLPQPATCPEFPSSICVELTGVINEKTVSAACAANSFHNDSGNVTCQGEDMSFGLNLKTFSGAPPSSYHFTAGPLQYPLLLEWDDADFATHTTSGYAVAETHEFSFRTAGVVYEEELPDGSRLPYLAGVFAVNWKKRPTCPSCADVRLRGTFSVYTGP